MKLPEPAYKGRGGCLQNVDVPSRAWHSRKMRDYYSLRRLLLTIVLSQALVIQGLLLAWTGTLAFAGGAGGFGAICAGAAPASSNDDASGPLAPRADHDCLSACLMSHAAGGSFYESVSLALRMVYARSAASHEITVIAILREPGFLARAPPVLT